MKFLLLSASFLLLAVAGCGGPTIVPVHGIVTRHGKPVARLYVTFSPPTGRPSWGLTDEQGHFKLHYDREHEGATLGEHRVAVEFRPRTPQEEFDAAAGKLRFHPEQKAILDQYGPKGANPLTVTIDHANQEIELHLD